MKRKSILIKQDIDKTIHIGDKQKVIIDGNLSGGTKFAIHTTKDISAFLINNGTSSVELNNMKLLGNLKTADKEESVAVLKNVGIYMDSVSNIEIKNMEIENFAGYGIYAQYSKGINIESTIVKNFGYTGIMGMSVKEMNVNDSEVRGAKSFIKSSIGNNTPLAYNIAFSRKSVDSLEGNERSQNCNVTNTIIADNPYWEGLDTHGGENITFSKNHIKNVKVPIAMVASQANNGQSLFAPVNINIKENTIIKDSDLLIPSKGIVVSGARDAKKDEDRWATGIVEGNKVVGYGGSDALEYILKNGIRTLKLTPTGSIFFQNTKGLQIVGNSIEESNFHGITAYTNNQNFLIKKNKISNVKANGYPKPSYITIRDQRNSGEINENFFNELKGFNATSYGVYVFTNVNNTVTAQNNEFINIKYNYFRMVDSEGIYKVKN